MGAPGPSKLPGLGKELGKTVKSFQGAAKVCLSLATLANAYYVSAGSWKTS